MGRRCSPWTIELAKELVEILKLRGEMTTPEIYKEIRQKAKRNTLSNNVDYNKVYRVLMKLFNARLIDRWSVNGRVAWALRKHDIGPEDVVRALMGPL